VDLCTFPTAREEICKQEQQVYDVLAEDGVSGDLGVFI
jgi:hypothetical protein